MPLLKSGFETVEELEREGYTKLYGLIGEAQSIEVYDKDEKYEIVIIRRGRVVNILKADINQMQDFIEAMDKESPMQPNHIRGL